MNKKIKLIDLLNKMAKKENLPKEIKFNGYIWLYIKRVSDYDSILLDGYLFKNYFNISQLNEEVEIIKEDKPTIEPITLNDWSEITYDKNWELLKNDFNKNMKTIFDGLNKIINYINEKEKELEEKTKIEKISINGKDIHKLEELGIYDVIEDIESTLNEIIDKIEKESK